MLIATDVRRIQRIQTAGIVEGIVFALVFVRALGYFATTPLEYHELGGYIIEVAVFGSIAYLLSRLQRLTARRIVALDLPQAAGLLVEALAGFGPFASREVTVALIRLLPRLQASDANLLTSLQRKHLCHFLRCDASWSSNGLGGPDLKKAVLRALEQVGDETALPVVKMLAKSSTDSQVCSAAQECLPFLQRRTDEAQVQQTLLRASGPGSSPEVLLRPATHGEETVPQQLLRASMTDEP